MKILLLGLFLIPIFCSSQEPASGIFPIKDSSIYYERIISIDSVSKDELFKRVTSWAVSSFNSQKAALQSEDKELGILMYRTNFDVYFSSPKILGVKSGSDWNYECIIKVLLKDGKAKIIIDRVEFGGSTEGVASILKFKEQSDSYLRKMGKGYKEKYYLEAKNNFIQANSIILSLIDSITKALNTKSDFDF